MKYKEKIVFSTIDLHVFLLYAFLVLISDFFVTRKYGDKKPGNRPVIIRNPTRRG
jgi:hypothetical protein